MAARTMMTNVSVFVLLIVVAVQSKTKRNNWNKNKNKNKNQDKKRDFAGSVDSARSETGSTLKQNAQYHKYLQRLLSNTTKNIRSIVDVGCGDFDFMQHVDLDLNVGLGAGDDRRRYHGYDVSTVAIDRARTTEKRRKLENKKKNGYEDSSSHTFTVSEPQQQYEGADLIIIKDVLQHLPLVDALAITNQLSKFKYALLINDVNPTLTNPTLTDDTSRVPLVPGGYRSLDVQQAPFDLICEEVHQLHLSLQPTIHGAQKTTCLVVMADQTYMMSDEL